MDIKISKASGNDITMVVTPQAKQTIIIDRNIVGAGVATGGTTGQVLSKTSNTNYDTTWTTPTMGTVTQVAATAGTGISVSGSPITSSGTLTITNTAPDQTVALTAGTGITTSGIYPNFTITNSAPDRTVALTGAGTTTVTGTYPNFIITSTGSTGTVTGVTGTAPIVSSGGTTPAISITSSGANSAVLRDFNLNISANSISEGYSSVAAAGITTILTAASAPNYVVTGSGGQTFQLPNATTLANGTNYQFNNNQTSGTIVVKNNSSTTIATIQAGGFVDVSLLNNSIAAGSWDVHNIAPSNVSWSTNTFDYAGSITSATWNGTTVQVNRGGTGASTLTGYVKGSGTTALTASATIPVSDINATGTPSITTYLRGDSTWSTIPAGMVYPSAGIPNSTGSAWGTSYGVSGTGSVALTSNPIFATDITVNGLTVGKGYYNDSLSTALGYSALLSPYGSSYNSGMTGLGMNTLTNFGIGVQTLTVTNGGSGYYNDGLGSGDFTFQATLTLVSGAASIGIYPNALMTVVGGIVVSASIVTYGYGFSVNYSTIMTGTNPYGAGSGLLLGINSFIYSTNNTAVGYSAGNSNYTGSNSVYLGFNATGAGSNEIAIGANSVGLGDNTVTIGNASTTNTYLKGAVSAPSFLGAISGTTGSFTSTLTATAQINLAGNSISAIALGSSQTSGATTIGSTSGTGTITIGQSTGAQTVSIASAGTAASTTKTVNICSGGIGTSTGIVNIGSTGAISTISVGRTTQAQTVNIATGATDSVSTKTVNIGTGGLSSSTTNIAIGATAGTSTTTLNGYFKPPALASAPTYVKGAVYFDTTLNKLRVGGATAWETITSV
jgi:hypothetical protein